METEPSPPPKFIVEGRRVVWSAERIFERFPEGDDLPRKLLSVCVGIPQEMDWWGVRLESSDELMMQHGIGRHILRRCLGLEMFWPGNDSNGDEETCPWRWPLYALPITPLSRQPTPLEKVTFHTLMPICCGERPLRVRSQEEIAARLVVLFTMPHIYEVNRFPVTLRVVVEGRHYK